jgi:hypothetical protein
LARSLEGSEDDNIIVWDSGGRERRWGKENGEKNVGEPGLGISEPDQVYLI